MARSKKGQAHRDAVQAVTQAAYAKKRGFSRQAIARAIAAGRIPVLRGGRINPRTADRALRSNTDPSKLRGRHVVRVDGAPSRGVTAKGPKLYESKARREAALAKLAELELAEREGRLIPIERHQEEAFNMAREVRDQLMAIPSRLAPVLLNRTNQIEVDELLANELRHVCTALAGDAPAEPSPATPTPPAAAAAEPTAEPAP